MSFDGCIDVFGYIATLANLRRTALLVLRPALHCIVRIMVFALVLWPSRGLGSVIPPNAAPGFATATETY